jgi:DMSO reductase anchor subunit
MQLEPRRTRSMLSRLDNGLLVVGAIVAAIGALVILGWVLHTVFFLIKVALVAAVFGLVFKAVTSRR